MGAVSGQHTSPVHGAHPVMGVQVYRVGHEGDQFKMSDWGGMGHAGVGWGGNYRVLNLEMPQGII